MATEQPEDDTASGIDPMRTWKDEEIDSTLAQEQQDIQYTRNKRKQIITGLMSNGVPQESKLLAVALTALNDMDRTSVARMRIKTEEKASDLTAANSELVAALLLEVKSNIGQRVADPSIKPPALPDDTDLSDIGDAVLS